MTRGQRIPDATREAIAAAYVAGSGVTAIGRQFDVSHTAVAAILRELEVPIRRRGRYRNVEIAYAGEWVRDGLIMRPTITRKEAS